MIKDVARGSASIVSLLLILITLTVVGVATVSLVRQNIYPATSAFSDTITVTGVITSSSTNCNGNIGCYELTNTPTGTTYLLYPGSPDNKQKYPVGVKVSVNGNPSINNGRNLLGVVSVTPLQ